MTWRRGRRFFLALAAAAGLMLSAAPAWAATNPMPSGLAVDADGNLLVADYSTDRVLKLSPEGELLSSWGTQGTAAGQFNRPFNVAVDSRQGVYVVDRDNNRVQRFDADGTFTRSWGSAGAGVGQLRTPFAVACDDTFIYVADFGNDRVQVFDMDGRVVTQWGSRGTEPGQFVRPAGIALGRDGSVYVSDHFNNRVEKFASNGRFLAQFGGAAVPSVRTALASSTVGPVPLEDGHLLQPEGLAVDADGNVYVADYGRDRVAKYGPDGTFLLAWGSRGTAAGEFVGPKGIVVDSRTGRIYVADTGNSRIQRFSPDGTFDTSWPVPPPPSAISAPGVTPL